MRKQKALDFEGMETMEIEKFLEIGTDETEENEEIRIEDSDSDFEWQLYKEINVSMNDFKIKKYRNNTKKKNTVKRKPPTCSTCGLKGHTKRTCKLGSIILKLKYL